MLILKKLDPSDSKAARAYRLQVKERLYRFNYVCTMVSIVYKFDAYLFVAVYAGNFGAIGKGRET